MAKRPKNKRDDETVVVDQGGAGAQEPGQEMQKKKFGHMTRTLGRFKLSFGEEDRTVRFIATRAEDIREDALIREGERVFVVNLAATPQVAEWVEEFEARGAQLVGYVDHHAMSSEFDDVLSVRERDSNYFVINPQGHYTGCAFFVPNCGAHFVKADVIVFRGNFDGVVSAAVALDIAWSEAISDADVADRGRRGDVDYTTGRELGHTELMSSTGNFVDTALRFNAGDVKAVYDVLEWCAEGRVDRDITRDGVYRRIYNRHSDFHTKLMPACRGQLVRGKMHVCGRVNVLAVRIPEAEQFNLTEIGRLVFHDLNERERHQEVDYLVIEWSRRKPGGEMSMVTVMSREGSPDLRPFLREFRGQETNYLAERFTLAGVSLKDFGPRLEALLEAEPWEQPLLPDPEPKDQSKLPQPNPGEGLVLGWRNPNSLLKQ